jgi:hypothetical protein
MNHRPFLMTMAAALGLAVTAPGFGALYFLELVGPVVVEIDDPYGAEIDDEITVRYTFDDSIITEQLFVDWLPGEPYLAGNAYLMTDIEIRLNGNIIHDELVNQGDATLLLYNEFPGADGHETGPVLVQLDGNLIGVNSNFGTAAEWLTSLDPAENLGITPWEDLLPGGGYHYGAAIQTSQWIIRYFPETYELGAVETDCAADLDGDDIVGFTDLTQLLGSWGPCPACPEDLDGDGSVGFTDLTELLGSWGPCSG